METNENIRPPRRKSSQETAPTLSRQQLLAVEIERHRAAARKAAGAALARDPFQDPAAKLAAVTAEARARLATSVPPLPAFAARRSIAAALPPEAQAAAGFRVINPKIWAADVAPITRTVDSDSWLSRVRSLARARVLGDVLAPTIVRVAELMVWFTRRSGTGFARVTHATLAKTALCCPETIRKAVRFLEAHGVLDTLNVLARHDGQVRRDANLYLLRPIAGEAEPVPDGDGPSARLARYAAAFGLRARSWGFNATPLSPDAPRLRPLPSPS